MTTVTTATVRTDVLAEILCGAKVLAATRRLIEGELRAQRARIRPNTIENEIPRRRELGLAEIDARRALDELTAALADAARAHARKGIQP